MKSLTHLFVAAVTLVVVDPLLQSATAGVILGAAGDFAVLGLNDGKVTINSATSIVGNVGYSSSVESTTNQKVDSFLGAAYVHSTANFGHAVSTFVPSGGILTNSTVDAKLDQANTDALAAAAYYAGLATTHTLGALGDDDSRTILSTGAVNVISLDSLKFKDDFLELKSRAGHSDTFIFNVSGNFEWASSEVKLMGTAAGNVLFNFLNASDIKINKKETKFAGTILATTGTVEYHNPATFNGAIIAKNINLHSDFNLHHAPSESSNPVPEPASILMMALGCLGVCGYAYRRRRITAAVAA